MPSNAAAYERLRILAEFLPSVPARNFSMNSWATDSADSPLGLTCGSAACACGWATAEPRLFAAGLHLIPDSDPGNDAEIGFDDLVGWVAIRTFFGIEHDTADHLFAGDSYDTNPSPEDVAARIREFLAESA